MFLCRKIGLPSEKDWPVTSSVPRSSFPNMRKLPWLRLVSNIDGLAVDLLEV